MVKPAVCSSRRRTRKREMSVVLFYSKSVMFHHRPCSSVVAFLLHIPLSQNTAVCISFCLSPFHSVSKVSCTCSVWSQRSSDVAERERKTSQNNLWQRLGMGWWVMKASKVWKRIKKLGIVHYLPLEQMISLPREVCVPFSSPFPYLMLNLISGLCYKS